MYRKTPIKAWLSKSLLSLLLAGGALSLAAQQNQQGEPAEKAAVTQAHASEKTPPGAAAEAATKSNSTPTPPPGVAVDSPTFEYEPTEKISEDLSVSYPVDI